MVVFSLNGGAERSGGAKRPFLWAQKYGESLWGKQQIFFVVCNVGKTGEKMLVLSIVFFV